MNGPIPQPENQDCIDRFMTEDNPCWWAKTAAKYRKASSSKEDIGITVTVPWNGIPFSHITWSGVHEDPLKSQPVAKQNKQ